MSTAPGGSVDRAALVLDRRLGQGGQGVVHAVANRRINRAAADGGWDVVYKEYAPELLAALDTAALTAMVDLLGGLDGDEGRWLCEKTAWPAAVVRRAGEVSGFLMRSAPDRFRFDFRSLRGPSGGTRRLANLEFLLNDDAYVAGIGLTVSERDRLLLLADLAGTLERLHRLGIAVGDLSPKNLLFAADGRPGCFLIDCDAMRLRGASVLPQAETPDWALPPGEEKATPAGDAHKLALLAVRLIARDQGSTDPAALAALSPDLGDLARRGLDPDPQRRPAPGEWAEHLQAAAETASTTPATAPDPAPAPVPAPGPKPAPKPGRVRAAAPAFALAALLAGFLLLVAQPWKDTGRTASPAHSSTPTPSPTPSPTPTPAPTPTPTVESSPAFDPASLDLARTDGTPLTANALLPVSFTDAKGVEYTRNSGSAQGCLDSTIADKVKTVLSRSGCDRQVVGTYTDSKDRIMVVVLVIPLADRKTAEDADDALSGASTTDWGFWCPKTGPGSELCDDGTDITGATQSGYRSHHHRYLLHSLAIYLSLGSDSSLEEWTKAAAGAALDEAGPSNYAGNH
ncbi:hypothetical protein [Kitasatospora cineracea]|uniref:hypothetical protein n=1 Tax=Kitasatospora cineracea TaxID=88074 RepID=UPI00380BD087